MASPAAQAYPRIREVVESFVADVQNYTEDAYEQLPTTTITESNTFRDRKHEYTVEQPSKIVRDTNRFKHFYFSDLAESLIDDGLSFCPHRRDDVEQSLHGKRIFRLAKLTLDYAGAVTFDEDAFDTAYEDHLAPLYASTHVHRVVFPLPRVILRPEDFREGFQLTLEPLKDSVDNGEYVASLTDDLLLSKIPDFEMTAMQTYGTPGMITQPDQTQKRLGWATTLEVEFEVTYRPTKHNSEHTGLDLSWTGNQALSEAAAIAKQVVTALRLWAPKEYAGLGPGYLLRDSWKTYRGISADVDRVIIPEFGQRGKSFHRDSIELPEAEQDALREHWQRIGPYCTLEDETSNTLYRCLTRFNRMYERSTSEDQIVDAFLGFETTLIRSNPGSALPNRAAALLRDQDDCDPDEVRAFLEGVRRIRNRIVHNDTSLSEELSGDYPGPNETRAYLKEVRWYLAQVVIAYSVLLDTPSDSIQAVNQTIVDSRIDQMVEDNQKSVLHTLLRTLIGR
jgi:hypothetical protein